MTGQSTENDNAEPADSAESTGPAEPIRFPSDAELMAGENALTGIRPTDVGAEGTDGEGPAPETTGDAAGLSLPACPESFRAGFACLIGRPNAGKSTLTNALVGTKVAIMSDRPQTTRHNVRGVVHRGDAQIVLVDTPGMHRPRTLLGKRLNDLVRETLTDVDVIAFCIPANERIGPGDRFIARDIAELRAPVVAVVTKADTVGREALASQLLAVDQLGDWADIVPVSAARGEQIDVLADVLAGHLPPSPPLYPTGEITDEPRDIMIAELVREAALEGVRDELPHSLAVIVDEVMDPRGTTPGSLGPVKGAGNRMQVRVSLVVERDSQKAIVIGKGGARLKEIGVRARRGIEDYLRRKVYLDLHVRTAKDWQSDPKALAKLGF
ncbi:GTPase Era [Actinomyces gaoshouyii]|uniref:GTPase Era n=1 Tax=Actinomyces gaoshouyii TaxID=1960083 RepID=UPI0009BD9CE5|nr:GTPase Era [Actinomyces gaoshouyii]ARD41828.1 GTPase Era [Actinomyces gaoshouyii]